MSDYVDPRPKYEKAIMRKMKENLVTLHLWTEKRSRTVLPNGHAVVDWWFKKEPNVLKLRDYAQFYRKCTVTVEDTGSLYCVHIEFGVNPNYI